MTDGGVTASPPAARLLGAAAVVAGLVAIGVAMATTGLAPQKPDGAPVVLQLVPVAMGFGGVGALLLLRRPESRIGWLLAAVGLLDSVGFLVQSAAPQVLVAGWVQTAVGMVLAGQVLRDTSIVGSVVLLPALFPTGEVATPRWRWLPRTALGFAALAGVTLFLLPEEVDVAGVALDNSFGLESAGGVIAVLAGISFGGMLGLALPAVASLVVRYRAATGVERLQLRWFVLSIVWLASSVVVMVLWAGAWNLGLLPNPSNLLFDMVVGLGATTIPVAIGAAVLRYRLYEIDRIVSRTVSWAVVTVALVAVYVGVVMVLQGTLQPLLGSGDVPVALATLTAAAIARPLLVRVRSVVDRRFNRSRYDALRMVEEFGRSVRDEVGLDAVVSDLRAAASGTVQPVAVGVVLVDRPQP